METLRVKSLFEVITEKHPYSNSLNEKILEDADRFGYPQSYKTKVQARMTHWNVKSDSVKIIQKWIYNLLLIKHPVLSDHNRGKLVFADTWIARYKKGDHTTQHNHTPAVFSFVYFVKCPPGSTPLLFTGSTFQQMKAEEGKVVIFPGCMYHYVPKNKSDDRVVMSGNLQFLHSGGISELLGSVNQENKPQE